MCVWVPACLCKHNRGVQSDKVSGPVLVQFLCEAGDKSMHKHRRTFTRGIWYIMLTNRVNTNSLNVNLLLHPLCLRYTNTNDGRQDFLRCSRQHWYVSESVGHKLTPSEQKLQNTNPAHIKVCNENIKCNIYWVHFRSKPHMMCVPAAEKLLHLYVALPQNDPQYQTICPFKVRILENLRGETLHLS